MRILASLAPVEGLPDRADFVGMRSDQSNESLQMHHATVYVQGQGPGEE
jgi:hypothetical protein